MGSRYRTKARKEKEKQERLEKKRNKTVEDMKYSKHEWKYARDPEKHSCYFEALRREMRRGKDIRPALPSFCWHAMFRTGNPALWEFLQEIRENQQLFEEVLDYVVSRCHECTRGDSCHPFHLFDCRRGCDTKLELKQDRALKFWEMLSDDQFIRFAPQATRSDVGGTAFLSFLWRDNFLEILQNDKISFEVAMRASFHQWFEVWNKKTLPAPPERFIAAMRFVTSHEYCPHSFASLFVGDQCSMGFRVSVSIRMVQQRLQRATRTPFYISSMILRLAGWGMEKHQRAMANYREKGWDAIFQLRLPKLDQH